MERTKRKTESHLIDEHAQAVLRKILPSYWTVRGYKPDYGIDLSIEFFQESSPGSYDTLGEHLFVQLKGTKKLTIRKLALRSRLNVEKYPFSSNKKPNNQDPCVIEAISFPLETSELVTIQRMGSSTPVLLVMVDVITERAFFLCLNDYIDKILLPENPQYARKGKKTIYIPIRNEITKKKESLLPLLFYGKRAKLHGAFQKFGYQCKELNYVSNQELDERAKYFAQILLRYDFWNSCSWWTPIGMAHRGLQNFLGTGSPGLMTYRNKQIPDEILGRTWTDDFSEGQEYSLQEILRFQEIRTLWAQLANLGYIHEEVCREWFLPLSHLLG